jgi:hypothetical protein
MNEANEPAFADPVKSKTRILSSLESAYDCIADSYASGRNRPEERAAFLDASRALRSYATLQRKTAAKRRNVEWDPPTNRHAFRRYTADFERFQQARAAGSSAIQERADFLEGLATLRGQAINVRKQARQVLARASADAGPHQTPGPLAS